MDTANFELSKELYGVSRWGNSIDDHTYWSYIVYSGHRAELRHAHRTGSDGIKTPAYDLRYLLRKLPRKLRSSVFRLQPLTDDERWYAGYWKVEYGATPEDAACKLAIELFKQGILTKEAA